MQTDVESSASGTNSSIDSSLSSEEGNSELNSRPSLKKQARILTQKILKRDPKTSQQHQSNNDYDADVSTVGKNNSSVASGTSGISFYFQTLNDTNYIDYAINRSKAMFSDDDVSSSPGCARVKPDAADDRSNTDSSVLRGIPEGAVLAVKGEEKKTTTTNKKWTTRMQPPTEEDDDLEPGDFLADMLEEKKEQERKPGRKKLIIWSVVAALLLAGGLAGLGVFLFVLREKDAVSGANSSDASGNASDSETPVIQNNPLFDNIVTYTDDSTAPAEDGQSSSSTTPDVSSTKEETAPTIGTSMGETLGDYNNEDTDDASVQTEQPSSTNVFAPSEEDRVDDIEDLEDASTGSDDLLSEHLKAYEKWKLENGDSKVSNDDYAGSTVDDFEIDLKLDLELDFNDD
jgi:hypothetical protein